MAATIKLLIAGEESGVGMHFSGQWRTAGSNVSTHVLHWARCNLHKAEDDPVLDRAEKPGNYFATRVRGMRMSADAQVLTLTEVEGVSLQWHRAPEHGWSLADGPAVSMDDLLAAIVRSVPDNGLPQFNEQRLHVANLTMQLLVKMYCSRTSPSCEASIDEAASVRSSIWDLL